MPTALRIKVPKRCNTANPKRQIGTISVWIADGGRPQVEGCSGHDGAFIRASQVRVLVVELRQRIRIVRMYLWEESLEGFYNVTRLSGRAFHSGDIIK